MGRMKWTLETLQEEANKYGSTKDFRKYGWAAYCSARRKGMLAEISKGFEKKRTLWTTEMLQEEALKYITRTDFMHKSHSAYECARTRGIVEMICKHMIPTHTLQSRSRFGRCKWTLEKLTEEALKYSHRGEFKAKVPSAYTAARKRGILDKICNHMTFCSRSWTNEEIHQAALLFNTRQDFQKGNHKAYNLAHKRGIIDKVCGHMKLTTRVSNMEKELSDIIRKVFSETKSLYDHRVKIEDKAYIKRFEIDIFVRSLMKGIEFDGTYHHSLEGLRRGRKHWPIEDVQNYHQIKDDWFATKGIRILHIAEKEWIDNKEKCIKKCFKFLGLQQAS